MIRLAIYLAVTVTQYMLVQKYMAAQSWWLYLFLASAAVWTYLCLKEWRKAMLVNVVITKEQ